MNESKNVRVFSSCIKASELQAAVQQVQAMPNLSADFMQVANFITLSVVPLKQNQQNIGASGTQDAMATVVDEVAGESMGEQIMEVKIPQVVAMAMDDLAKGAMVMVVTLVMEPLILEEKSLFKGMMLPQELQNPQGRHEVM